MIKVASLFAIALSCTLVTATLAQDRTAQDRARDARAQQYSTEHLNEMQVRHECVLKAQQMHPGDYAKPGIQSERISAYAACTTEKGVRP
jgi:hypothetical protein